MKQFARPFLSILLLLSTGGVWAKTAHSENTEGSSPCAASCDTGSTASVTTASCGEGCSTNVSEASGGRICNRCATPTLIPRPQGRDTALFFYPYLYGEDMGDQCFTGFVDFRYQQTFKGDRIAQCLFGTDVLRFEGSQVPDRTVHSLVADNFGLAPNFKGFVRLDPRIRNYNVDFAGRTELGPWMECLEGAYFELNATATHSQWDLRACTTTLTPSGGDNFSNFPACDLYTVQVPATDSLNNALERHGFNLYGRGEHDTKTALANIDMILGYDFLLCEDYHVGLFLIGSAPTGNRPDPFRVFSPIIGNGHHWELGGGLTAHYELWNCDDQSLGLYLNGHVEHLFKDTQYRNFDLRDSKTDNTVTRGCLSRFLLLKEFNPDNTFDGHIVSGTEFTRKLVETSFKVQGDASLRFLYRACGWAAGVGYNVYGRTHERINRAKECCDVDARRFGIKGTTGVCALLEGNEIPLTSTQSFARITTVTDEVDNQVAIPGATAWNGIEALDSVIDGAPAPVILTQKDIRFEGMPRFITHKVFGHVDYQWEDCECKPYLGLGGEVEFAQGGREHPCTVNQWGVWVRTGVSF